MFSIFHISKTICGVEQFTTFDFEGEKEQGVGWGRVPSQRRRQSFASTQDVQNL